MGGRAPIDPEAPLFVVGAERSGTTLLRLMLDHHPQIACPNELDFAVEFIGADGRWPALERFRRLLESHGSFRRSGLALEPGLDYPDLVDALLRQQQGAKPRIAATVHRGLPHLPRLWPGARYVHLVRDPRDVARSVVAMGWAGNVWAASARWLDAEASWDALAARVPAAHTLEIRYEDLVGAPEATLARICAFAGLAYDGAMLSYSERSSYAAPDPALGSRWQRSATAREVRLVESRVGERLAALGYVPGGPPAPGPGPLQRCWLALGDRAGRIRFRVRRFGAALVVADIASRLLGLEGWQRSVRRRILAIQDRHVV